MTSPDVAARDDVVREDAAREDDTEPVDLLVIGFGPVGATLSGLAARHGLSVLAIDREVDLYPLPRAAHCDHEILRILQELGCADEIVSAMQVNDGMDFLTADDDPHRLWWSTWGAVLDAASSPELLPMLGDDEAVVLRPDRYVFGAGTPDELTTAAAAILGR